MSIESGSDRKKGGLSTLLSSGAILAAAGGLIAWGATQQRLEAVEQRAAQTALDQRDTERRLAESSTQIAVMRSQLETIIRQLATIDAKLDQQDERRRQ